MGFVQQVASHAQTTASFVLTAGTGATGFSGTTTVGNRLILVMEMGSGGTISGIADSKGNTWTVDQQGSSGAVNSAIASAPIGTALATGNTITVTLSASVSCHAGVIEASGAGAADTTANGHFTSTVSSTLATSVTSLAGDFVVSCVAASATGTLTPSASDPDSGSTWGDQAWPYPAAQLDSAYQTGPGTPSLFSVTWNNTVSGVLDITIVAYRASTSPGVLNDSASGSDALAVTATFGLSDSGHGSDSLVIPGPPVIVGSYIDETQYSGSLTHAQAIAHWQSNSGQHMACERLYEGPGQMPSTCPVNVAANVGQRVSVLSCKPLYAAASNPPLATSTSQATLDTQMNNFLAGLTAAGCNGTNTIIPIWHEPYFGGITGASGKATAADFIAMFQHYAPIVHSHGFPTAFITSAASVWNDNENSYYPGDAYVDYCLTDYYYPQYSQGHLLGTGIATTDPAYPADHASPPKPFGIGEFNNSTDPTLGTTKAQGQAYWGYILSYFQARVANGQPSGPIMMFNSDSGAPNALDSGVVVADGVIDPYGGGTATEYRNALISALVTGLQTTSGAVNVSLNDSGAGHDALAVVKGAPPAPPGPPPMFPLALTVELLLNNTWTDISPFVYQRDPIQISGGRVNWADTPQPASCTMTLNNADGRFTQGFISGAYYPFLQRNVQIRVGVTAISSSGNYYSGYRFWGSVPDWPPQSDISGNDVFVQITASGPMRQINTGTDQGSALERYYENLTGPFAPIAYWPCEEDTGSSPIGSGNIGSDVAGPSMTVTGTPTWKAITDFDGSKPIGILNGSTWDGLTGDFASSGDDVFTDPGTYQWVAGTTTVNAKVWGASGGGGNGGGDGGGGGEFAQETTLAVTPGNTYPVVVGTGGAGAPQAINKPVSAGHNGTGSSFAGDTTTVLAHGGQGGFGSGGGGGNGGTGSSNSVHHNGGNGGIGLSGHARDGGGGGGSSAGTAANGNNGQGGTSGVGGAGGAAPTGGAAGGNGGYLSAGSRGIAPGGGGGGGGFTSETNTAYAGGSGADGKVELVYTAQSVPTNNVIRFIMLVPVHGGNNGKVLLRTMTSGTIHQLDVVYVTGGKIQLKGYNASLTLLFTSASLTIGDGNTVMVSVELTPSGANMAYALRAILPGSSTLIGSVTGTQTAASIGNVSEILAGPNGDITKTAMGHISLQYALVPLTSVSNALAGHTSEMTIDRFIRLANEQALDNAPQFNETQDHYGFELPSYVASWQPTNGTVSQSQVTAGPNGTPWSFSPADVATTPSYFDVTTSQAAQVNIGDSFNDQANPGQIFTVSSISAPSSGIVSVTFTPMATTSVMGPADTVQQIVNDAPFDPSFPDVWPTDGSNSLLLTSAGGAGQWFASSPAGTSGFAVNPGDTVSVAADIYTPAALGAVAVHIDWYNAAGAFLSNVAPATVATTAGQIAVYKATGVAPPTSAFFAVSVHDNETVTAGKLLYVDNVRITPRMGPQTAKAYAAFLKEIQTLDQGLLKESKNLYGLGYITRIGLMNQPPDVVLDYSQGTISPPLLPVYDDHLTTNTVTVKRYKGTSVTVTLATGSLSTQEPPAGVGKAKKTLQTVAEDDTQLPALAAQLLTLGTVVDERYPVITVDLTRASINGNAVAPLMSAIANVEPGSHVQLINLPFWYPDTTTDQLVIGYSETLYIIPRDPGSGWIVAWNCVPYTPWVVTATALRRW